jgi:GNAT superfamily N-acetyltransferase
MTEPRERPAHEDGVTASPWTADVEGAARALLDSWGVICASSPGGRFEERGGAVLANTGLPVPPFNGVWSTTRDVAASEVVEAVEEFAGGDLPWNVQLRPGYPDELDEALAELGLVVTAEIPLMVLPDPTTLADSLAAAPARFRQVETFADVDSLLSLLERGFGMPPEMARRMFPIRLLFLAATWLAATGDDGDVSTGLGFVHDGWCGIFNVATPEEHRGRGFGGAVTAHAVDAARAAGARGAYLQSSPMGLPVYERLGFVTVELWRQWMPSRYLT